MSQLIGYIGTIIVGVIVGLLVERFKAKPKLLYWLPGSFHFNLKNHNLELRTDSLTIQNTGSKPATDIEIIYQEKLDHFQFSTAIAFSEKTLSSGEYVIQIPSLGGKEFVNIQMMSHVKVPVLLNVRSAEGRAHQIQVHLQRLIPKWVIYGVALVTFIGLGFITYWFFNAIIFLSKTIGVI